jgi:hypothetical protein
LSQKTTLTPAISLREWEMRGEPCIDWHIENFNWSQVHNQIDIFPASGSVVRCRTTFK